jgi:hypothetical protein
MLEIFIIADVSTSLILQAHIHPKMDSIFFIGKGLEMKPSAPTSCVCRHRLPTERAKQKKYVGLVYVPSLDDLVASNPSMTRAFAFVFAIAFAFPYAFSFSFSFSYP